ncbi:IclR family transcriptional regulator [Tistrella bauzanensis]|uniref:IclR family transcriptional regulator n=1 Tax=Tistrella arctica TaxID=3133430 RepID=A0ABU9YE13_9PROT
MKSLTSALAIYGSFATTRQPLGISDICERTGLAKSQVSKVLSTFRDQGFLEQDPVTRKYRVGPMSFLVGVAYAQTHGLTRQALPIMREIADRSGHSAVLTVREADTVFHLMAVEGQFFVDSRWRVGMSVPFHATAAGKILTAYDEPEVLARMIAVHGLPQITPKTITDPDALALHLRAVRACGSAVTAGESAPGLVALAVPVFGETEQIRAALSFIMPQQSYDPAAADIHVAELHSAARSLSFRLGAETYPFGGAPAEFRRAESA